MSSATSDVTYTSVYTDSEPDRAFWGADDEEISEGGIPRVIVLGYDGLPLQPVAPPSSDYIPGPEDPQVLPIPQDKDEHPRVKPNIHAGQQESNKIQVKDKIAAQGISEKEDELLNIPVSTASANEGLSISDTINSQEDDSEIPPLEDIHEDSTADKISAALEMKSWVDAMQEELFSLRFKKQEEGIDYDEFFALWLVLEAYGFFLAICHRIWAFIALYGVTSSSRAWFKSFNVLSFKCSVKRIFRIVNYAGANLEGNPQQEFLVFQLGMINPYDYHCVLKAGQFEWSSVDWKESKKIAQVVRAWIKSKNSLVKHFEDMSLYRPSKSYFRPNLSHDDLSLLAMAALESCPKQNMIAYLEKTEGNVEFHEVIDFFGEVIFIMRSLHITAKVAGKFVSISEASIRTDLIFDDADGIDSLPNQAIFDAIQLMGYEGDLTVLTCRKLANISVPLDHFPVNSLTSKVFSFMIKKGKHFSGKVTPLFDTMLVQPTQDEGASSERLSDEQPSPSPAPTSEVPNESLPDSSSAQPSEVPFEQQPDPSPSPSPRPSPQPSPTPIVPDSIPEPTGENLGDHSSNDTSLLGNEDDMTLPNVYDLCISLCQQVSDQAKEIKLLKAKITKLKKQAKPVIKHFKAYLKTVSLQQRLSRKSSSKKQRMHKKNVSKQGRKIAKGESSVQRDPLFDVMPEDNIDHMETDNAQSEGRTREMVDEDKELDEDRLSTEDAVSTDKEGVSTDFEKVSTDKPIVSTDGSKVSTDEQIEGADDQVEGTEEHNESIEEIFESTEEQRPGTEEKVESTAGQIEGTEDQTKEEIATQASQTSTQTPTSMIFGDDETIATLLLNMSKAKAVSKEKEKGVELKDVEEIDRPRPTSQRSLLTLKPLPKIDPKDKGKKKIEEDDESKSEDDDIPQAVKKFKQLESDEELARKVQEEWEAEEERSRIVKEEATNEALIKNFDDIKARIEADRILAEKLQEQEREQFTIEERAKFLHDTIVAQRRFLAQQRSEAIRNKPPTKNQLRNQMMTYIKHVGNFKHSELKSKKFEDIQAMYEKIKRSDEDFIAIGSVEDESLIKKMKKKDSSKGEEIKQESKEEVKEEDEGEEKTRKRKHCTRKKMKSRKRRFKQDTSQDDPSDIEKENNELRLCLTIVPNEDKEVDYELLDKKYPIIDWKTENLGTKPQFNESKRSKEINMNVVTRSNGQKRTFSTLMRVLSVFDREDLDAVYKLVMDIYQNKIPEGFDKVLWGDLIVMFNPDQQDEFWNSQAEWNIIVGSCTVLRVINSPCFLVKSWLVQDQTVLGKDYSNLLIADSLLKTIWFINAPCYDNEALASPNTNDEELSIPEQTATGKGTSNPLMAGSLPKTTKPT
ncbi:hypothetical protein Tco_1377971 [Tanacetum coccineum]